MRTLVESLKRLYQTGQLTRVQIDDLRGKGKINRTETEYITEARK